MILRVNEKETGKIDIHKIANDVIAGKDLKEGAI